MKPRRPPSRLEFEIVLWGNLIVAVVTAVGGGYLVYLLIASVP